MSADSLDNIPNIDFSSNNFSSNSNSNFSSNSSSNSNNFSSSGNSNMSSNFNSSSNNSNFSSSDFNNINNIFNTFNITPPSEIESKIIECSHDEVYEGSCIKCNAIIVRSQNQVSKSTQHIPSIEPDLNKLDIDERIKNRALEIHKIIMVAQGYPIYRDPNRTKLIFFCLYQAYQDLGDKLTPYAVADMVGMARNLISNAKSMCSEVQTGYKQKLIFVTALDRLPYLCEKMNLSVSALNDMKPICENFINSYKEIDNENPCHVAGAIIKLYMNLNGIVYDESILLHAMNIKKIKCLDRLYAEVQKYL